MNDVFCSPGRSQCISPELSDCWATNSLFLDSRIKQYKGTIFQQEISSIWLISGKKRLNCEVLNMVLDKTVTFVFVGPCVRVRVCVSNMPPYS